MDMDDELGEVESKEEKEEKRDGTVVKERKGKGREMDEVEAEEKEKGKEKAKAKEKAEVEAEVEAEDEEKKAPESISEAAKIMADRLSFISEITGNPKKAEDAGYTTGSNIAVLYKEVGRMIEGKATLEEILSMGSNIAGVVKGFMHTAEAVKEAEKVMEELKKKVLKKIIR